MRTLILVLAMLLSGSEAFAQNEAALAEYFQGQRVKLKIDMPSTKDGVDIYPKTNQPFKFSEYASRLKQHGLGLRSGETVMITKVKVKEQHIEFQLGGGGYGTVTDSLGTIVAPPSVRKSEREKNAERDLKNATDPETRKDLQAKAARLRNERRREERLLAAMAQGQRDAKRAQAEEKAPATGSRFNIRFPAEIAQADVTPEVLKQALAQYLEFER